MYRGYSKFRAKKTTVDGIKFDSKGEADRYITLKGREDAGEITDLQTHPSYDIEINGQHICKVELDFEYIDLKTNQLVTEDYKGRDLPLSRLKRKMVLAAHGVEVRVVKKAHE